MNLIASKENGAIVYKPAEAGGMFWEWARKAIELAKEGGHCIILEFNEIRIAIYPDSTIIDIARIYDLKVLLRSHGIEES